MAPIQLAVLDDVLRFKGFLERMTATSGVVGDTRECPVSCDFAVEESSLMSFIDGLRPLLPDELIDREEDEYMEILEAAVKVCAAEFTRDTVSRRAIVIHPGCLTYQHFYLRDGVLHHTVHMRSQDLRKFLADLWLLFRIQEAIIDHSLPDDFKIDRVELHWGVDCFHAYLNPSEVPL